MTEFQELYDLGLSKAEISVYLYLLKQGLSSPAQVSKGTGIARPHCYSILESLVTQGLITSQKIKNKRQAYLARDPEALFETLKRKQESIERILPDLRDLHATNKNKPQIQYFDGKEEVKLIFKKVLEADEIYSIGSTAKMKETLGDFYEWTLKEIKKRNIVLHDIVTGDSGLKTFPITEQILKGLYDAKVLNKNEGEASMDILIWNNNIALISYDEPVFGTIITNQPFAQMFKIIHKALTSRM
ncbi:MAG: helix-turn-helix domain-containing protein [Patescibacteria group bacterium]|nr:helix-turn-helix domain-containing protein [Patescibacteria group bacterium]